MRLQLSFPVGPVSPVRPGFASVHRCLPFDAASCFSRVLSNTQRCPFLSCCNQQCAAVFAGGGTNPSECWFTRVFPGPVYRLIVNVFAGYCLQWSSGLGPIPSRLVIGVAGCVQPSTLAWLLSAFAVTAFFRPNGSRVCNSFCRMLSPALLQLRHSAQPTC